MSCAVSAGKKKAVKELAKPFPQLDWQEQMTWQLLELAEKSENRKVLFGKQADENTSGDRKITVYGRIGKALFPELHELDGAKLANKIKAKLEGLIRTYRKQKARLVVTGGGLRDDDEEAADEHGSEFLKHYIPAEGPNAETPEVAKNLWEEITKKFPFFPALHRLLSERPNITPIAITTGIGPLGRRTIHLQPLNNRPEPTPDTAPNSPTFRTFGDDATNGPPSPVPSSAPPHSSRGPKASVNMSAEKLERLQASIQPVSKKRGIDAMLLDFARENAASLAEHRRREDARFERTQLLEEYRAGVWTLEEYRKKLKELLASSTSESRKRPRLSDELAGPSQRDGSPEWDAENGPLPSDDE